MENPIIGEGVEERVALLKKAQANGGILPLALTADELKLAKQMKEEGLLDSGAASNSEPQKIQHIVRLDKSRQQLENESVPTFEEFRQVGLEKTKQMSIAGLLEGYAGYEYQEDKQEGNLENHIKEMYKALNDEELEIFSRLMGFSKEGEKQSSSTMQEPARS